MLRELVRNGDLCVFCNEERSGQAKDMCLQCLNWDHSECIYEDIAESGFSQYYCPICKPEAHEKDPGPGMKKLLGIKDKTEEEYVPLTEEVYDIDSDEIDHIVTNKFDTKDPAKSFQIGDPTKEFEIQDHMEMVDSDEEKHISGPYSHLTHEDLVKEIVKMELALQRCELLKEHKKEIETVSGAKRGINWQNIALKKEIDRLRKEAKAKDNEISNLRNENSKLKAHNKRLQTIVSTETPRKRPRVEKICMPSKAWMQVSPRENVSSPTYNDCDYECYTCQRSHQPLIKCTKCTKNAIHQDCATNPITKDWQCPDCTPFSLSSHTVTSTMDDQY